MKFLRLGDPHVKPTNIKESEALMEFAVSKALEFKVDVFEILGDIYDTHDIVRLKVLKFWTKWFKILSEQSFKTVVLVGNHDMSGDYLDSFSPLHTALHLENEKFKIVHEPYVDGVYGYLPYTHSNDTFVEEANKLANLGAKVLVSHPNYEGAVYDNGVGISNGVDPNSLSNNFRHLIGGHIHTELEIGRVWYTGNPRWLTKSCANKKKGFWICDHDDTGQITNKEFISTESVCTPIVALVWKEGEDKPTIPENAKVDVELIGSSDWIAKQKLELKDKVSISSKTTDPKRTKERKSGNSLYEFLSKHYETDKREKLLKYLGELRLV
jgi:DNA repair exonuclease SbcCD nuclease subunit